MKLSLSVSAVLILAVWLERITWVNIGVLLVLTTIVYGALLAVYRGMAMLYSKFPFTLSGCPSANPIPDLILVLFSPLADIPGPKLAGNAVSPNIRNGVLINPTLHFSCDILVRDLLRCLEGRTILQKDRGAAREIR